MQSKMVLSAGKRAFKVFLKDTRKWTEKAFNRDCEDHVRHQSGRS